MLTQLDKSNYLKGLLIVARIDNSLIDQEKDIIRNVATKLGFSKDFYEEVIKNLMINENISDNPLMFSSAAITEVFIDEALNLAFSDNDLSGPEVDWLKKTAEMNGISNHRFSEILTNFTNLKQKEISSKVSASA
ncbi:MAG: hypothetical protein J0L60_07470 [Ignavibacteria bacterium]|nr:hypothetical protein [Ignavibacteria bacterium]